MMMNSAKSLLAKIARAVRPSLALWLAAALVWGGRAAPWRSYRPTRIARSLFGL